MRRNVWGDAKGQTRRNETTARRKIVDTTRMGLIRAILKNLENGQELECHFNPTEYVISQSQTTGIRLPAHAITVARNLAVTLLLDRYEQREDVRGETEMLWEMATKTNGANQPHCQFAWGEHLEFIGLLSRLTVRYVMFREDGVPVRAFADLVITEKEPDSVPTPTPVITEWIVGTGQTLSHIAHAVYGDAEQWRRIADANHLDNPLALKPGMTLQIPQ